MEREAEIPCVLAFPLQDAQEILSGKGWSAGEVSETSAPVRGEGGSGELLVVRQQHTAEKSMRLTVSRHPGLTEPRGD